MTLFSHAAAALAAVFALYLASIDSRPRAPHRLLAAAFFLIAALHLLASMKVAAPESVPGWLRPVLAMGLGPLFYLHLATAARPEARLHRRDLVHVAGPLLLAGAMAVGSGGAIIDATILGGAALYGGLIALGARGGAASFKARGAAPAAALARWRLVLLGWFALMIAADILIAAELSVRPGLSRSVAFAAATASAAAFIAWVLTASLHRRGALGWVAARMKSGPLTPEAVGTHEEIAARLDAFMEKERAFLDPDLTLTRLARRLALPARSVSQAVNAARGVSFSRWLAGWRVGEAQRLIEEDPARDFLDVMMAAGFRSKSTFNALFRDMTGMTPGAWRAEVSPPPTPEKDPPPRA